jgi:hypothetical protein
MPQSQSMQGYHFPPPEPDPAYAYGNPQPLAPQQQWGQPAGPYELSYQAYAGTDPSPFAQQAPHHQQGYPEPDADYGDEFFDDEEPRRGRRWVLIVAALVGAIGVGGALAYTYRSLVAPHSRLPVVKSDPTIKVKPGKDFASERGLPVRPAEETPPAQAPAVAEPPREGAPVDTANLGPRVVKSIPITSGGTAAAPEAAPVSSVPGITLYQPPQQAAPPTSAPPPRAQPQPGRVVIGTRPAAAEPADDAPPQAPAPPRRQPVQTAALAPKLPPPRPREPSSGGSLGYVAVLSSQKSSMDALKVYADMREKYPDVLSDKTPDVQEADLSARGLGTMYRLVVGPPGSHNAAQGVCTQLKSAGYVGCWVKSY